MLLLSFLQKQQTSVKPFKPSSDQLEISPCHVNALQNKVVMRIEHMITEDESKWYFNKFSPLLLLEMNGNNKTEFWYFSHHQGKQAPIYHNSFLFIWTERCRPLPAPSPLFYLLWYGKANVQNVCSRISYRGQQSGHFQVPKNSHFQNVAKCKTLLVKMSFIRMRIKKNIFISMASHLASLWNTLTRLQSSLCFFTTGIF